MAEARLERFLKAFGDVRGRETRAALTLTAFFFLITCCFYIIKPVKESFLIGFATPRWWPFADLATALLIGFVVALNARLLDRLPRRTYLTASLLFFIASLFVFWYVFGVKISSRFMTPVADTSGIIIFLWAQARIIESPLAVFVLIFCFWADVFIAMSITQFWIAVNDVFDPYQAKRLVGLFVSGGLIGGIAGSAVAALTTRARLIRPENLLLVCPVILALAIVTVNFVYAEQRKIKATVGDERIAPASKVGYLESFRAVLRSRYLILLAAMLASASVAGSLINYQFKQVTKTVFVNDQARTSFIALFFLLILVISTVFHLATTGRVLRSFGIRWAILIAPAFLLVGSAAVFLIPAGFMLYWAGAVRGGDKTFDNTISQSIRELLYVPVPADVKYKAKIFIDMFINKFATGLGAGLFFVLYAVRNFAYRTDPLTIVREIGVLAIFFLLLWVVLTRFVYSEYPAVLKRDIRRRWKEGRKAVAEHIDVDLTLKIFNTLQSRERSTTLYYMNIFNLVRGNSLTPELKELLGIKRSEIKARAMDSLLDVGGESFYPGLEETIADAEFQSEVDLVFLLPAYQELMGKRLGEIAGSASEVDRIEAANSISRMAPTPPTLEALARLLQDPSPEVVLYALISAAVHRRPEHVPLILRQLANPMAVAEAQAALSAYGPGVEAVLGPVLRAADEPLEVRRAIPEILARIGTQRAADILLEELARRQEDMEHPLVDALYKIRTDCPEVRFRVKAVRPELLFLIRKCCDLALNSKGSGAEAKAALDIRIKRVFDLMTLIHPPEDIVNAYQNLLQGTAKSVDYSLEHLDNLLDRELKGFLFPLIEDLPPEERDARLRRALGLK